MAFENGTEGPEIELNGQEFDLNDPTLFDGGPDWDEIDPEGELVDRSPQPPPDGDHVVFVRLEPRALETEKGAVYLKAREGGPMIIAVVEARVANDEGQPGAFLKQSYVNSLVFKGQTTSALAALLNYAGRPFRRGMSWQQMAEHVKAVFAEAPEEGFQVVARTRWIKSVLVVDPDTNEPVLDPAGKKQYVETKGQKRITAQALASARLQASELDEDEAAKVVRYAEDNPHMYLDPVKDEMVSVRAEIDRFVGPVGRPVSK